MRSIPESGLSHDAFVGLVCGPELALRAAGPWHFNLFAMQGIVTMPSYHTVMAVIFTYAFRGTGLIGYGIATLNLVMLVSIPPIGGHYLVDMLAGGALALGAIAVQRAPWQGVSRIQLGLQEPSNQPARLRFQA